MEKMLDQLQTLAGAWEYLGPQGRQQELEALITDYHSAAWLLFGGSESAAGMERLGRLLDTQWFYADRFANAEGLSDAQIVARLNLYAGALKATASAAQNEQWPLPFHPTQGSECKVHCRCAWNIQVLNAEELDADAYWDMNGSVEHCPTCIRRAGDSPYRIRGGVLI